MRRLVPAGLRVRRYPGLAVALLIAAAALAVGLTLSMPDGGGFRSGATFLLQSPDRWLALLGFGLVLGGEDRRATRRGWIALICGAALGAASRHSLLWPWMMGPSAVPKLHLLGPAACLFTGLLLVVRSRWRSSVVPFAVFAAAAALSLSAGINDPAPESPAFLTGAALSALSLVLIAANLRRRLMGPWIPIGERIAGSWLLTIGLLLSAVQMVPAPAPLVEAAGPATAPPARPPAIPDFEPAVRPAPDGFLVPPSTRAMPKGTN